MNLNLFPIEFWLSLFASSLLLLVLGRLRSLRWRPAWLLRIVLLLVLLIAVFLPEKRTVIEPPPAREVLIIDQSESLSPEDRGLARAQARQWLADGENRLVILVGVDAIAAFNNEFPTVDSNATNIVEALELAAGYFASEPGRVIIATDGNVSDPLAVKLAMDRLQNSPNRQNPTQIEFIALRELGFPTDVYVGPLYLPSSMWENSPFTAVLPVFVTLPGDVTLDVNVNDTPVLTERLNLPAGQNLVPINLQTTVSEIMTISAKIEAEADPRSENNTAHAALRVFPAPRLLILTEDAGLASRFAQAIGEFGLDADLMLPEDLPTSLNELSVYQVILVQNILASSLTEGQMRMLQDFVQKLGRGLIFTGGRNAYTLGGYKNTVLEPLMPVTLEPPPRQQDSSLTLVLVLDRSASMDGPRGTPSQLRPLSLAREAALRSAETLSPEDFFGILSYNTLSSWSLPIQPVGSGDVLQNSKNALAALSPSGGTEIFSALRTTINTIIQEPFSDTKHIVLLSDGNDQKSFSDYLALAELAVSEDITISTISLGVEADQELMALLADAGKGRHYPVLEAANLPKILIDESQAARDENVHEGQTFLIPGEENHPVLSSIAINDLPAVVGYNALESKTKEGAENILISVDFEDPLLAGWQYGLGRTTVWTSDIGEEWATSWQDWDAWGRFWSGIIRYTLPDPAVGPGQVAVNVDSKSLTVEASLQTGAGVPRNHVEVKFSLSDPSSQIRTYAVPQVSPGRYQITIPRPANGAYRGVVIFNDEDGFPTEIAAPVIINYHRELQPGGGGNQKITMAPLITWGDLLPKTESTGNVVLTPNQLLVRLLVLMLILWPIEIAIRRRWMPWR